MSCSTCPRSGLPAAVDGVRLAAGAAQIGEASGRHDPEGELLCSSDEYPPSANSVASNAGLLSIPARSLRVPSDRASNWLLAVRPVFLMLLEPSQVSLSGEHSSASVEVVEVWEGSACDDPEPRSGGRAAGDDPMHFGYV